MNYDINKAHPNQVYPNSIATQPLLGWYRAMNYDTKTNFSNSIVTPLLLGWYRSMNYDINKAHPNWIATQPLLGWYRSMNYHTNEALLSSINLIYCKECSLANCYHLT